MAPKRKTRNRRPKGSGGITPLKNGKFRAELVIDGKLISRTTPTRQAAEAALAELQKLKIAEIDVSNGGQTVAAWFLTWLAIMVRQVKPQTLAKYRYQVDTYVIPVLGTMRLDAVRAHHIQSLIDKLTDDIAAASSGSKKRQLGTRTAHLVASRLRAAFTLAADRKLILDSPMRGVVLPKHKSTKIVPPDEAQVAQLLTLSHKRPHTALWHIYALLGLRKGEGIGIRWADIDWAAATITIAQQVLQPIGLGVTISEPKSEAGKRTLPAPAVVFDLLKAHQIQQMRQRLKRAATWQDNDLVFCARDGTPLAPDFIDRHWQILRRMAKIEGITLHYLRHGVATLLDEAGASEALKQGILGHEARTITNHYTHSRLDAMRRVLEKVAERVLSKVA